MSVSPLPPRRAARLTAAVTAAAAAVTLLLAACGSDGAQDRVTPVESGTGPPPAGPSASASARRSAPQSAFAVGVRTLNLSRSADRPLPTTIWYPASGSASRGAPVARKGASVAQGRFPLVLASHGLTGLPEHLAPITTRLAAAGFIVAAPAYPHTNRNAAKTNVLDVANQPADAFFVLEAVIKLGVTSGDALFGRIDSDRIGAAGHSAGGFTTGGMFSAEHGSRLKAGIIVSGGSLGLSRTPEASILFVHGDSDEVVSYDTGKSAYNRLTWPKAFLTVVGGDHTAFLAPRNPAFSPIIKTITDFLRSTLYDDAAARSRLAADGSSATTRYEQELG
ncbi:MAG: hypothetical protein JXA67_18090 [Micromonosporaceae bacterium]|nr:hypothetical protein [Micromonosporaceae bacterium]